ncbi:MAG TPA: hypothetical protein VN108_04040 [Marmoricola sp.]|nr:hypothetical protein [Marmoricola sp.]
MWLGGNPEDIRRHAVRLRALADTVSGESEAARRRLDGVEWESVAAQSFRLCSLEDFAIYDRAINEINDAARSLDRLAHELASRQQALMELAERIGRSAEELWNEAKNLGEDVLSYANGVLDDLGDAVSVGLSKGKDLLDSVTWGVL